MVRVVRQPQMMLEEFLYQIAVDGEYPMQLFCGDARIVFPAFPELDLTAEQVVAAGE